MSLVVAVVAGTFVAATRAFARVESRRLNFEESSMSYGEKEVGCCVAEEKSLFCCKSAKSRAMSSSQRTRYASRGFIEIPREKDIGLRTLKLEKTSQVSL